MTGGSCLRPTHVKGDSVRRGGFLNAPTTPLTLAPTFLPFKYSLPLKAFEHFLLTRLALNSFRSHNRKYSGTREKRKRKGSLAWCDLHDCRFRGGNQGPAWYRKPLFLFPRSMNA